MKPPKSDGLNRPFEALGDLLRTQGVRRQASAVPKSPSPPPAPPTTANEETLFLEAMTGVRRTSWDGIEDHDSRPATPATPSSATEMEIEPLRRLVDCGQGFRVADTPEYMEGVGGPAPPEITRRLHRGEFAVQAHVDLHGFSSDAAQEVFDAFMKDALATGKRAVLIIHGRGLSSPAQPVLKTRVAKWLTTGYWRKWVIAFASARLCDGGSGASYVLLRRKPVTKRLRRRLQPRATVESTKNY
ncbi:MAG: Smr/MutS family endonuclease [Desulfobacterales bacterium]|jgi:DNA-nicking Smr family endonuclease|nr:Smr/MutS family endonuclease [Desulfobacterales bacterium]